MFFAQITIKEKPILNLLKTINPIYFAKNAP